jgi:hypothetical protein
MGQEGSKWAHSFARQAINLPGPRLAITIARRVREREAEAVHRRPGRPVATCTNPRSCPLTCRDRTLLPRIAVKVSLLRGNVIVAYVETTLTALNTSAYIADTWILRALDGSFV